MRFAVLSICFSCGIIKLMESNDFKWKIMKSLLIGRDKPILKKADSSLPWKLFQYNISGHHMIHHIM